jgi:ACS family glucarate transporter-like MFS transporter
MNADAPHTALDKPRPTNARYLFLLYAGALSLILYLDRNCIAESAQAISTELGLSSAQMGWVFTAFLIGYLAFEVPSGAWGDRYGPKRVLCRIVIWWSLFTAATALIWHFEFNFLLNSFTLLLLVRFLFGIGEAGAYPNLARCTSRWFALRERGFAQGVIATAGRLGAGITSGVTIVLSTWIDLHVWAGMGWRVSFWVYGLLGVVWVLFFAAWFRNSPADHPSVNAQELAAINEGIPGGAAEVGGHLPNAPWRAMLSSVNLWAFCLMGACSTFAFYLYLTWFPRLLQERYHIDRQRWGWVAGLPLVVGAAGCLLGGVLTDRLLRHTHSRRWARRIMGLAGKGGGAVLLLLAALTPDPAWAVLLIALSAFASDLAMAATWAVCTDAGGRFVGTVFGFMNTVAGIGGALIPVLVGYLLLWLSPEKNGVFDPVAREHAWGVVLYLLAAVLGVCALCWFRIDAEESRVGEGKVALTSRRG